MMKLKYCKKRQPGRDIKFLFYTWFVVLWKFLWRILLRHVSLAKVWNLRRTNSKLPSRVSVNCAPLSFSIVIRVTLSLCVTYTLSLSLSLSLFFSLSLSLFFLCLAPLSANSAFCIFFSKKRNLKFQERDLRPEFDYSLGQKRPRLVFVYFNWQMGASHAVLWLKSSFSVF